MSELSPEAAKVLAARKAAVEELKGLDGIERPINDHLVMRLAGARLYAEGVTMRVIAGESVTAVEFKAANDMIEAARDALPQQALGVKVTIVPSVDAAPPRAASVSGLKACRRCGWKPPERDRVARCYRCGWAHGDDTSKPWKRVDLGGPLPGEQASKQATADVPAPVAVPAAANVVPLPPPPPRRDPATLGIHNARLPDGTPARMRRSDYTGMSPAGSVYSPLEQRPDFEAKHPLPPEPFWPAVG